MRIKKRSPNHYCFPAEKGMSGGLQLGAGGSQEASGQVKSRHEASEPRAAAHPLPATSWGWASLSKCQWQCKQRTKTGVSTNMLVLTPLLFLVKVFFNMTCHTAIRWMLPAYLSSPPHPNIQFLLVQASLMEHKKQSQTQGPKDCRKKDFSVPNPVLQTPKIHCLHVIYKWKT